MDAHELLEKLREKYQNNPTEYGQGVKDGARRMYALLSGNSEQLNFIRGERNASGRTPKQMIERIAEENLELQKVILTYQMDWDKHTKTILKEARKEVTKFKKELRSLLNEERNIFDILEDVIDILE